MIAASTGSASSQFAQAAANSRAASSIWPSNSASWPRMLERRGPSANFATSGANARAWATSPATSIQSTARSSRSSRSGRVALSREAETIASAADSSEWTRGLALRERIEPFGELRVRADRGRGKMPEGGPRFSTSSAARRCRRARRAGPIWS